MIIRNRNLNILPIDIVNLLREQLIRKGKNLFSQVRDRGESLQCSCPAHKMGMEHKPSCGISIENPKYESGTVHCFTCNYTATIPEMISKLFGFNDFGRYGETWLLKYFLSQSIEKATVIEKWNFKKSKEQVFVKEEELKRYRYYHDYMWERKLTEKIVEDYDIGYDEATDCLTFPVRDHLGRTLYVFKRSVRTKFFKFPDKVEKAVYGIYEYLQSKPTNKPVVLVESPLNATTAVKYGDYAIALQGLYLTPLQLSQIKYLKTNKIIVGMDGDEAGDEAYWNIQKKLSDKFLISSFYIPTGRDINDLQEDEYHTLKQRLIPSK